MSTVLFLNVIWQVSTLALVALGLAIVFGKLQIMNTANLGLSPWLQVPVCIATVALTAVILERIIIRHLYGRMFDSLLATWGCPSC
jgi:branched-subunit amino acid ABC-type transport system permease component